MSGVGLSSGRGECVRDVLSGMSRMAWKAWRKAPPTQDFIDVSPSSPVEVSLACLLVCLVLPTHLDKGLEDIRSPLCRAHLLAPVV